MMHFDDEATEKRRLIFDFKWRIAFWSWMLIGMPACIIGGAVAGVLFSHFLKSVI